MSARPVRPLLYRVPEVMAILNLSRTVIYQQIRAGRLRSVKQGTARLISAKAIDDYIALLETETTARTTRTLATIGRAA